MAKALLLLANNYPASIFPLQGLALHVDNFMIQFDVITIFSDLFKGFISESLLARAQKHKLLKINLHYLRKWTNDRHQTVDDRPYGGGPGMLLKVEPIFKAVEEIRKSFGSKASGSRAKPSKTRVILFSPRGKKFDQKTAKRLSKFDQLILICGRYEGIDERVADKIADEVVSIGDYVLSGGEVPAMVLMEAVSRMIPGVLGKEESAVKFDHAQYTRPEVFIPKRQATSDKRQVWKVPKVLLSGDHKKIEEWREKHS